MPHPHIPPQPRHRLRIKHVPHHPVALDLIEPTAGTTGDDAGGVLAAVLEEGETFDAGGGAGWEGRFERRRRG